MITLVQKAVNYFVGSDDFDRTKTTEAERPRLEDFVPVLHSEIETRHFEGIVTSLSNSCIVIEYDIYCDPSKLASMESVGVNDHVRGVAERRGRHEAWRVTEAQLIQEEWDADTTSKCTIKGNRDGKIGRFSRNSDGAIPCWDLAEGIPGILKQDLFSTPPEQRIRSEQLTDEKEGSTKKLEDCKRILMGQVKGVFGDTLALSDNVNVQLSPSSCDFNVMEGDWVVCELEGSGARPSDVNAGERAGTVKALRRKKLRGELTHQLATHFVINHEIHCLRSLAIAVGVRVGDRVVVEVIESEQGWLKWRAVSLTPAPPTPSLQDLQNVSVRMNSADPCTSLENISHELLQDKENVVITQRLRFPEVTLGSCAQLEVSVRNSGSEMRVLRQVYLTSVKESQITIRRTENDLPVTIYPGAEVTIKLECTGKLIGEARTFCIFDFGEFRIGRHTSASITDPHLSQLAPTTPHRPSAHRHLPMPQKDSMERSIPGEKPYKPPTFLQMSLPLAHIPGHLWAAAEKGWQEVVRVTPCLLDPLTLDNHKKKLSTLLHLEEIEMICQMRQFDVERTTFEPHGEYLSLSVTGLKERRPSLMVGDTVEARTPRIPGNTSHNLTVYQGYIHLVLQSKVLVKFHPEFHNQYHDEDYTVSFNFNRTPLRRCHFALSFAMMQLGPSVLFPCKLKLQLPQVCYIDPEAPVPPRDKTVVECKNVNKSFSISPMWLRGKREVAVSHVEVNGKFRDVSSRISCQNYKEDFTRRLKSFSKMSESSENVEIGIQNFEDNYSCVDRRVEEMYTSATKMPLTVLNQRTNQRNNESACSSNDTGEKIVNAPLGTDSSKSKAQRPKQNSTPPRIPVVTRLFGVHSSSSSSNSSMCCSDDEVERSPDLFPSSGGSTLGTHAGRNLGRGGVRGNLSCHETSKSLSRPSSTLDNNGGIEQQNYGNLVDKNSVKNQVNEKQESNLPSQADNSSNKNRLKSKHIDILRTPQVITPAGKKLFLPRTLELEYYKNVATKEKGVTEKTHLSTSVKPERGYCDKSEERGHYDNTHGNLGNITGNCGRSDVLQVQRNIPQDFHPSSKKELKIRYLIPVLPIHPNRKRGSRPSLPVLTWFNKSLNWEQKLAVRRVLEGTTRPLPYVIFGPPGTGKTVTMVEAVLQIFTLMPDSRVLVATPSNSASDLIAERLVTSGGLGHTDLLRLNAYQRSEELIPETLRPYCQTGNGLDSGAAMRRVTVATATTAGLLYTLDLHNCHYTHVMVDEAGQLTEPETLLVMGLVNQSSGQVVLAGDPKQLGPVVVSRLAVKYGLQQSLLHRLCQSVLYQPHETGVSWFYEASLVTQLVHNYRSHPDILAVPSELFYNKTLLPSADLKSLQYLLMWDELPRPGFPLLFHGIIGQNMQEGDSPSWFNPVEAFQVVRYTKSLISFGTIPDHIGIITPYRKQVEKVLKLLRTFGVSPGVKVGSVEEFQGQEKQVILISTVRSAPEVLQGDVDHCLGFVGCPRRFNVAVTRAQGLLVVLGDPLLLSRDTTWRHLITFCVTQGGYRGPDIEEFLPND